MLVPIMKFVILSPGYTDQCGGILMLHRFCHNLTVLGQEAYIVSDRFHPEYLGNKVWLASPSDVPNKVTTPALVFFIFKNEPETIFAAAGSVNCVLAADVEIKV